jgi:myo-inositol-1(or 4)-monophosphatase
VTTALVDPARALDIAKQAVAAASSLLSGAQQRLGVVRSKSTPRDLVTEWDLRAEQAIVDVLTAQAPGVGVLGEESGATGDIGRQRWLVDPIDGTVNFAHGLPMFAVSVSLEQDGRPVAAVTAAPALGWEFSAHAGGGAFMNGDRMCVSSVSRLDSAMLATGFPYDRAETRTNFREWEQFQCAAGACRRFGAASLDLALVARGWFDGYWETRLKPWDLSAGALLVAESGGKVTDITGEPFASSSGRAIASNGAIHDQMVAELAAVAESSADGASHG